MLNESYVIEDVYFNYYQHQEPVHDKEIRVGFCEEDSYDNYYRQAIDNPNTKFIFNSVKGWDKRIEEGLRKIINS